MDLYEQIEQKKEELGIFQIGLTTTDRLEFPEEVRHLCEVNYCGRYGKCWACPPGVGPVEEWKKKILQYDNILVFTTKHPLEDSFDFEGMMDAAKHHGKVCERVINLAGTVTQNKMIGFSGEGCDRCDTCTYPDDPCRFPDLLSPSLESCGIMVSQLASTVGVNYINGANTVTYFGAIAF